MLGGAFVPLDVVAAATFSSPFDHSAADAMFNDLELATRTPFHCESPGSSVLTDSSAQTLVDMCNHVQVEDTNAALLYTAGLSFLELDAQQALLIARLSCIRFEVLSGGC